MYNGWLILDKPLGISSASAVYKVKKALGNSFKVGHAGTLDPLATGILLIAIGQATKLIQYAMIKDKEYIFTLRFGSSTSTDDTEGEIIETSTHFPTKSDIVNILCQFKGVINQAPPIYSAININGKRAYELARSGIIKSMPERKVKIKELELVDFKDQDATFRVICSKGTYIRSLGRDIAIRLGSVGHITYLRRTKSGKFLINDSILLDNIEKLLHNQQRDFILSVNSVLDDIPALIVEEEHLCVDLRNGKIITVTYPGFEDGFDLVQAINTKGKLLALGNYSQGYFKPVKVFNY